MVTKSELEKLKASTDSLKNRREEESFDLSAEKASAELQDSKIAVSFLNTVISATHAADRIKAGNLLSEYQGVIDDYKKRFMSAKQLDQLEMLKHLETDADDFIAELESDLSDVSSPKPKQAAISAIKRNLSQTIVDLAQIGERATRKRDAAIVGEFINRAANKTFSDPYNWHRYSVEALDVISSTVGELSETQKTEIDATIKEALLRGLAHAGEIDELKDELQDPFTKTLLPQNVYRSLAKLTEGTNTAKVKKNKSLAIIREAAKGRILGDVLDQIEDLDQDTEKLFMQVVSDYVSNVNKEDIGLTSRQKHKHEKLILELPAKERRDYRLFIKDMDEFSRDDPRKFVSQILQKQAPTNLAVQGRFFDNDTGKEVGSAYFKSLVDGTYKEFETNLIKTYESDTVLPRLLEVTDLYIDDALSKGDITKRQADVIRMSVNPLFGENVKQGFPRYLEATKHFGRALESVTFERWRELAEEIPNSISARNFILLKAAINTNTVNDENIRDFKVGGKARTEIREEADRLVGQYKKQFTQAHPFLKRAKGVRTLAGSIMKYNLYQANKLDPVNGATYAELGFSQINSETLKKNKHIFSKAVQRVMETDDFDIILLETDERGRHSFGIRPKKNFFGPKGLQGQDQSIYRLRRLDGSDFQYDLRQVISGKGKIF